MKLHKEQLQVELLRQVEALLLLLILHNQLQVQEVQLPVEILQQHLKLHKAQQLLMILQLHSRQVKVLKVLEVQLELQHLKLHKQLRQVGQQTMSQQLLLSQSLACLKEQPPLRLVRYLAQRSLVPRTLQRHSGTAHNGMNHNGRF